MHMHIEDHYNLHQSKTYVSKNLALLCGSSILTLAQRQVWLCLCVPFPATLPSLRVEKLTDIVFLMTLVTSGLRYGLLFKKIFRTYLTESSQQLGNTGSILNQNI